MKVSIHRATRFFVPFGTGIGRLGEALISAFLFDLVRFVRHFAP